MCPIIESFFVNKKPMKDRIPFKLVLVILGLAQFFVVPVFSSQSLGCKVALFSFFTILLAVYMVWHRREWILPWPLIPLICLIVTFLVSLSRSSMPYVGMVDLGTFVVGFLFCVIVANLCYERDDSQKWVFKWLQIVGSIVGILCLYQYFFWVFKGPSNEVLIPYLLPPSHKGRVSGVFGQSNLTALLLLLTIIAFLYSYFSKRIHRYAFEGLYRDIGFLFVSTAFFLTGSRAGLISLFLISAFVIFFVLRGILDFSFTSAISPILILVLGFVFTLIPLSPEIATSPYTRSEMSVEARFLFWTASFLIFLDAPFFGVGLDHFKLLLPSYSRKAHDVLGFVKYEAMGYTNWSHNEYVQILAESGIVGFIFLTIFFIMLTRIFYKKILLKKTNAEQKFLVFLVLPFFIQGMFSWPFRHPALLFVFFLILGVILSKAPSFRFHLKPITVFFIVIFLLSFILGVVFIAFKEFHFNQIKKESVANGCEVDNIINAMNDSYLEFNMLREVLPLCISDNSFLEDRSLLEKLKPYFKKISSLQGTYSQWYNLALIHRNLDEYYQAENALQKAVQRQPEFELGWAALHVLHVEEAARQTGRPIEDFLPPNKKYSADYYDLLFKRQ
jgi:O-antigen ligase